MLTRTGEVLPWLPYSVVVSVQWTRTIISVPEVSRSVELCAQIEGERDRTVTVGIVFTPLSASMEDYNVSSHSLSFPKEMNETCLTVSIVEDGLLEGQEEFLATLTLVEIESQIILNSSVATITIESQDSELILLLSQKIINNFLLILYFLQLFQFHSPQID